MKKLLSIALLVSLVACSKSALAPDQAPQYVMTIHYNDYVDSMPLSHAYECYPSDLKGHHDSIGYYTNYPDTSGMSSLRVFIVKPPVYVYTGKTIVFAGDTIVFTDSIYLRTYRSINSFTINLRQ